MLHVKTDFESWIFNNAPIIFCIATAAYQTNWGKVFLPKQSTILSNYSPPRRNAFYYYKYKLNPEIDFDRRKFKKFIFREYYSKNQGFVGNRLNKTISRYKILEKIGEGGMGVVYKAEDTKLKRAVALKFLSPELTRDVEAKARFMQEAQAASILDHPNICTIYEISETNDGQLFIAMAYYEGETLKEN